MDLLFRALRILGVGEPLSADFLARKLNVTRDRIAQTLTEARGLGVDITASRGQGYVLNAAVDWLTPAGVAAAMGAAAAQCDLHVMEHVLSTNDAILQIPSNPSVRGVALVAELQHGGRGRRGRRWHTGLGNALTFSLMQTLRVPQTSLPAVSLVAGIGVCRALRECGAVGLMLKWPNDLISAQGKLGGILVESVPQRGMGTVVIGIGINVTLPAGIKSGIDQAVCDARALGLTCNRDVLLGACLRHLLAALAQFEREGFDGLRQEWQANAAYLSQHVSLLSSQGHCEQGIMVGIAEDGALLLGTAHGQKKIYSGDVSLRHA